jgi:ElaB/YqjD/DUF883 family membrane-anchored ribosome-binding protein
MAEAAKKIYLENEELTEVELDPKVSPEVLFGQATLESTESVQRPLNQVGQRLGELVASTKQSAAEALQDARERGNAVYQRASLKAQELTRDVRDRAVQFKEERPIVLLAIVACTAFVLGFITRIGRSRHA